MSERVAIAKAIEEREKPKAAERKRATQAKEGDKLRNRETPSRQNGASNSDEPITGRADEIAARAAGFGKDSYRKAKEVVEAAEQEPERFADAPGSH